MRLLAVANLSHLGRLSEAAKLFANIKLPYLKQLPSRERLMLLRVYNLLGAPQQTVEAFSLL